MTVTPGHWCAIGFSTVTGNIDVTGATSFFLYASAVGGNVTITGTTSHPNAAIGPGFGPANAICADGIYGNLAGNKNEVTRAHCRRISAARGGDARRRESFDHD